MDWIVAGVLVLIGLAVYARLGWQLAQNGGRVSSAPFQLSDLFTVTILGLFLGALAFYGFSRKEEGAPMTTKGLYESALLFAVFVAGVLATLRSRNLSAVEVFGLRRVSFGRALALGAVLILLAYPLVFCSVQVMNHFLGERASTQRLIEFFARAVSERDYPVVAATILIPVLVAPVAEEIIFRGYIYGTLKRYLHPWAAIVIVSVLFAVIHLHLTSLLGLFVLAVCFTLAYEMSGSLLVPMAMHVFFNLFNLVQVFISSYWRP